jgi:hypothetical protein
MAETYRSCGYNKYKRSVQLVAGEICESFNVTPLCFNGFRAYVLKCSSVTYVKANTEIDLISIIAD